MYILQVIYPKSPKNASKATFVMSTFSCIFCTSHPFFSPAHCITPSPSPFPPRCPAQCGECCSCRLTAAKRGCNSTTGAAASSAAQVTETAILGSPKMVKKKAIFTMKTRGKCMETWDLTMKHWDLCVTIANLAYKSSSNSWVWSRFIELVDGVYISWMREWKKT